MDPMLLAALVVGVVLLVGAAALVAVLARRPRVQQAPVFDMLGRPNQGGRSVRLDPTTAWQSVGPLLAEVGMTQLDAETYMRTFDGGQDLFLTFHVGDGSLRAWLDRLCSGGVLEQYLGAEASLRPGEGGRSDLERLVAGSVRELLAALPHGACLTVKAPEIPGDRYKANLTTPFSSPDQASTVARVLLTLDEAAHRPAPAGSHVRPSPVVIAWQAAAPSLAAVGMTQLDAETYMRSFTGGQDLFVTLHVRDASLRGWLDRPCPGGALEQYLGAEAELRPGDGGRSELARFVAASVREIMGTLPHGAHLTVKAPEIPGDSYKASLTTPFSSPEQASTVARVLLALDEAAHRPAAAGFQGRLPPVVMAWQAAAPSLAAQGMTLLDAETYMRSLAGGQDLFLTLSVRDATVRGWLDRPCPGGILERFLRAEIELQPGDSGRSEVAAWVANGVREPLGALPRAARLTVKAPEIPGDSYKASLTTPLSSPEQASVVVHILLLLDEAVRRPIG